MVLFPEQSFCAGPHAVVRDLTLQNRPVTALLDACVLAGLFKRKLLLSFAQAGLFRPVWSAHILAETISASRHIYETSNTGLSVDEVERQLSTMQANFPDALVLPTVEHVELILPDPNDHHIVEAAVVANATLIVTDNGADFPRKMMKKFDIDIVSADEFLARLATAHVERALSAIETMVAEMVDIASSREEFFDKMRRAGLKKTARFLREHDKPLTC